MTWVTVGVTVGSAVLGGAQAKKAKKRDDQAAADDAAYEQDRQNRISQTQGVIDASFNDPQRQAQYATFGNALRDYYGTQLNKKKLDASRSLKFGLAKQGLVGSSVAVDRNKRLGDEFSDAALGNEREVQSAVAGLKQSDEQARVALRNEAANGLQLNQAGLRASEAERSNLGTADVAARAKGVGDVFSDTMATYKAIQERKLLAGGYNAARQNLWGAPPSGP